MRKVLINLAYLVALVVYSPVIIYRMFRQNRYREGWCQRLGHIDRLHPDKPCIWIHAVSVGEVNATRTLIPALQRDLPDCEILITSTTDTGYARAKAVYENHLAVSYFPFDFSPLMERAFQNIRPAVILLLELEIWPNLVRIAEKNKVPVAVVNGRISDRSFPKYQKLRPFIEWMFKKVSLVLAQTNEYAERFRALGCPNGHVKVAGSVKYDTAQTEGPVEGADRLKEQIRLADEPLWVAGGTGPTEEQLILDVYKELIKIDEHKNLRLAVIPRKPERFDEVAALIEKSGFSYIRYSELKKTDRISTHLHPVILGDTMGDLRKFYALAQIVFVGRSLTPMGGSDMMEPTGLGKCTLFGPYTFNFRQTVEVLLAGNGAVEVANQAALEVEMKDLLNNSNRICQIAENGRRIICENKGATERTVQAIQNLLKKTGEESG